MCDITKPRYIQIRDMDIANGEFIGCSVYFQGCHFHCYKCFNEETWDFAGGKEWTDEITSHVYELVDRKHLKRISFLGGEPMEDRNLDLFGELVAEIKRRRPDMLIWVYSGYLLDNLVFNNIDSVRKEKVLKILNHVDILVDGQFKYDLRDFKMKFRGSTNQRILNVQNSLKSGEADINWRLMELRD